MKFLLAILDFIIPRFVTEDVALLKHPDGSYETICSVSALFDDEKPDGVISVTCFSWLGHGWFPKQAGEFRKWDESLRS